MISSNADPLAWWKAHVQGGRLMFLPLATQQENFSASQRLVCPQKGCSVQVDTFLWKL